MPSRDAADPEGALAAGIPHRIFGLAYFFKYLLVSSPHCDFSLAGRPIAKPDSQDVGIDGKRLVRITGRPGQLDVMIPLIPGPQRISDLHRASYCRWTQMLAL